MSVPLCDAIRGQHYIRTLLARQVDGFIIPGDRNELRPSLTHDIPVPVVYAYCESADPDDFSVFADDKGGARLSAEHLVSLRRKHIGHITGPQTYRAARDRRRRHPHRPRQAHPRRRGDRRPRQLGDLRRRPQAPADNGRPRATRATAAAHLFAALDGQTRSGVIRQSCRLVIRDSTAPLATR
ncbi:MAG: hypothetical protein ABIQ18_36810 [Umezawaea sp.]